MKLSRLVFVVLSTLIISACTIKDGNLNSQNVKTLQQNHQKNLENITAFQATGSLAYFSDKTRHYGRFYINQMGLNEYQLRLTSPVGGLIFSLTVTPYLAELTDNNGNKYRDENVERLMHNLTGMDMPLSTLHSWLIGLSDSQNDKIDDSGRLYQTKLSQKEQTWHLTIGKYMIYKYQNKKIDLPTKIELTKQTDKLRLTINEWKIN